jgi:hypothetical protein
VVVVVVVVAATPNYLRQASQNLGKYLWINNFGGHPPGRTDKNLCRCLGAPACRIFPDHLIIRRSNKYANSKRSPLASHHHRSALLAGAPPTSARHPGGMGEPIKCTLVASFAARQAIIMAAVLLFVLYTWIQIRRGVEKRSLTTLVADASKQAGQQAFGGAMMVVLGVLLAHHKYDSLAWYAAECAPQPRLAAER